MTINEHQLSVFALELLRASIKKKLRIKLTGRKAPRQGSINYLEENDNGGFSFGVFVAQRAAAVRVFLSMFHENEDEKYF